MGTMKTSGLLKALIALVSLSCCLIDARERSGDRNGLRGAISEIDYSFHQPIVLPRERELQSKSKSKKSKSKSMKSEKSKSKSNSMKSEKSKSKSKKSKSKSMKSKKSKSKSKSKKSKSRTVELNTAMGRLQALSGGVLLDLPADPDSQIGKLD